MPRTAPRQTLILGWAWVLWGLFASLMGSWATPAWAQEIPQLHLPRTLLSAGIHQIEVQVAQSPLEHEIGLMMRKDMPQQEGMLFIFDSPQSQCFWMKNTLLPLTAAFVADDGKIVNLADMKPQPLESHCSAKPVRFVLEMNQGWFQNKGLKAGSQLMGSVFNTKR